MSGKSKNSDIALLAALDRIREGKSVSGVQELTVENVALEAGVGRATGYRCEALKRALGLRVKSVSPTPPSSDLERADYFDRGDPAVLNEEENQPSSAFKLRKAIRMLANRCMLYDRLLAISEEKNKKLLNQIQILNKTIEEMRSEKSGRVDNVIFFDNKSNPEGN